ncbi:MAG: hypothetical protein U1A78_26665 [Polyangia bacterium]
MPFTKLLTQAKDWALGYADQLMAGWADKALAEVEASSVLSTVKIETTGTGAVQTFPHNKGKAPLEVLVIPHGEGTTFPAPAITKSAAEVTVNATKDATYTLVMFFQGV